MEEDLFSARCQRIYSDYSEQKQVIITEEVRFSDISLDITQDIFVNCTFIL